MDARLGVVPGDHELDIRMLRADRYDEMVALWRRSGLSYKPKGRDSREAVSIQMKNDPELFLGAFDREKLVGVVIGSYDGRKGWINRLAVDPAYRGRGIARTLIREVEGELKKKGTRIISALIEEGSEASIRLFKGCGYVMHRDIFYLSKRESDEV